MHASWPKSALTESGSSRTAASFGWQVVAKDQKPKYRYRDGVIAIPREVVRSPAYRQLSLGARCAMVELQDVWRGGGPVHMSARRLAEALGYSSHVAAANALKELLQVGFIEIFEESNFISGKARSYRLTWLPDNGREPTCEYKKLAPSSLQ